MPIPPAASTPPSNVIATLSETLIVSSCRPSAYGRKAKPGLSVAVPGSG